MAKIKANNGEQKKGMIIGSGWIRKNGCIGFLISKGNKDMRFDEIVVKPGDSLLVAPRKKEKEKDPDYVMFIYDDEGVAGEAQEKKEEEKN